MRAVERYILLGVRRLEKKWEAVGSMEVLCAV
jgi:hypothetical protein